MDRNKLDTQMDRRMEKLDLSMAASSGRKPIEEYNREFFLADVYYEDAVIEAKVIICFERLQGEFKGNYLDSYGPWVVFKILDIKSGDFSGKLAPGAAVLAKWDNRKKVYTKFIYSARPAYGSLEVQAISTLTPVTEYEIVTGKLDK